VIALRSGWLADARLPLNRMVSSRRRITIGTNRGRLVLIVLVFHNLSLNLNLTPPDPDLTRPHWHLDSDQVSDSLRSGWLAGARLPVNRMVSSRRRITIGTNRGRLILRSLPSNSPPFMCHCWRYGDSYEYDGWDYCGSITASTVYGAGNGVQLVNEWLSNA